MTDEAYKAKRELQDYRQLDKRIGEMTERIAGLIDRATRATASMEAERVSGTGARSNVETAVVTKIQLERQLDSMIDDLNARRFAIQNAIDAMQDTREKRILELRYIDGRSWASVTTRMEISEPYSYIIHESALNHFAEIFF